MQRAFEKSRSMKKLQQTEVCCIKCRLMILFLILKVMNDIDFSKGIRTLNLNKICLTDGFNCRLINL